MTLPPLPALPAACLMALGLGGPTYAQVRLNEIFSNHCGPDDMEFVEISGPEGMPLDGYLVCVVEGDSPSAGNVDRVWNLAGQVIPAGGLFVLGDAAVAEVNFVVGVSDIIENGTTTIYLVRSTDPAAISALVGTNVDLDNDRITDIATHPSVTEIEAVGFADPDYPAVDVVYDCAPVFGPEDCSFGPFRTAGIFRPGNGTFWCTDVFLDFNNTGACGGGSCPLRFAGTPGAINPVSICSVTQSSRGCLDLPPFKRAPKLQPR